MPATVEREKLHQAVDELPDAILVDLCTFIEFLQFKHQRNGRSGASVQVEYLQTSPSHSLRERLAQDYDELAAMYDELAEELDDEVWLPSENEALSHVERVSQ